MKFFISLAVLAIILAVIYSNTALTKDARYNQLSVEQGLSKAKLRAIETRCDRFLDEINEIKQWRSRNKQALMDLNAGKRKGKGKDVRP